MQREQVKALVDAISDVLETMCFFCPVPLDRRYLPSVAEDLIESRVSFKGATLGELRLAIPKALAGQLAAVLTSRDVFRLDQREIQDAFMEVSNMIAGGFLHRIDPRPSAFIDSIQILDAFDMNQPPDAVVMDLDGQPILAEVLWGDKH